MTYAPASGLYSCPLAMTDGATKTLLSLPNQSMPEVENAIKRLTSRDPSRFWTSGQWYKFFRLEFTCYLYVCTYEIFQINLLNLG